MHKFCQKTAKQCFSTFLGTEHPSVLKKKFCDSSGQKMTFYSTLCSKTSFKKAIIPNLVAALTPL